MSGVMASTHEANNASAEANRAPKTSSSTTETTAVRAAGSHACTLVRGFSVRPSHGSPRRRASGTAAAVAEQGQDRRGPGGVHGRQREAGQQAEERDPLRVPHEQRRRAAAPRARHRRRRGGSSDGRRAPRSARCPAREDRSRPTRGEHQGRAEPDVAVGHDDGGEQRRPQQRCGDDAGAAARCVRPVGRERVARRRPAGSPGAGAGGVRVLMTGSFVVVGRSASAGSSDLDAAAAVAVGDGDGAAVQLGDPARDGQAETGAAAVGGARGEPFEDGARGRQAAMPGPSSATASQDVVAGSARR